MDELQAFPVDALCWVAVAVADALSVPISLEYAAYQGSHPLTSSGAVNPRFGGRQFLALASTALVGAAIVSYPTLLKFRGFDPFPGTLTYVVGNVPELYKFFSQQPKESLIASLALEADNLPTFAKRSVLVAPEYALPYSKGYYAQFSQRALDLINAQYSPDLDSVENFIQKYGVDFWLLDREYVFTPQVTTPTNDWRTQATNHWIGQYQPAATEALVRFKQGTTPALASTIDRCSVLETKNLVVLEAACIMELNFNP